MLENKYQFVSVPGGLLSLRVACPLSSLKPVLTWIAAIPNSLDLSNFTLPTGTWHPPPGLDCHGLLFWVHPTREVRLWTASPYPQQEQRPLGKQQPPVGYGYRLQRGCISSTNGGCIMVFSLLRNQEHCAFCALCKEPHPSLHGSMDSTKIIVSIPRREHDPRV